MTDLTTYAHQRERLHYAISILAEMVETATPDDHVFLKDNFLPALRSVGMAADYCYNTSTDNVVMARGDLPEKKRKRIEATHELVIGTLLETAKVQAASTLAEQAQRMPVMKGS